jgi:hypothetical protein
MLKERLITPKGSPFSGTEQPAGDFFFRKATGKLLRRAAQQPAGRFNANALTFI